MMESNTNDFTVAYQFYVSAKSEGNDDLLNLAREQILSSLSMFFNAKVKQYCETHSCVDYNTREEMKQSARIYALGKLDSYDVTRNVKFSTYINKGLEKCIAKAAMSFNETVDIPDRILRVHSIIRDTIEQIQREGVEVTQSLTAIISTRMYLPVNVLFQQQNTRKSAPDFTLTRRKLLKTTCATKTFRFTKSQPVIQFLHQCRILVQS